MTRLAPLALLVLGGLAPPVPAAPASTPKVWAVVVGVDGYEDALIPRCEGAIRDARSVHDWLARGAGWGEAGVLRMDDLGRRKHGAPGEAVANLRPTRENLDWAVVEWLGHRVGPGDVVVLYFAGQAAAKGPRPGAPAGRTYLLPIDARGGDVHSTGWSLDDALDKARGLLEKKARVVIWLDTSPLGRGRAGLPAEGGGPSGRDWLRALTRWPGVTAWLAADGRPAPEGGQFVAALRKALGTKERAHNLLGTLQGVRDDPELARLGFQAMGGVGPGVSLWPGGALVVERIEPELVAQSGHGDRVTSVLVTADNARMVTSSRDSTVRVWSLADRSLSRVLADPMVGVEALALDRDGSVLVAGDGVGRLIGWDLALDRPKPFFGPLEHARGVVDLAFLPEGKAFVSRDRGGRAILWDAGGGALRKLRDLSDRPIGPMAWAARPAPGAPALVASSEPPGGGPATLLGFDPLGRPAAGYPGPGGRVSALGLSRDGRRLAAGDDDGRLVVLDLPAASVASRHQFEGAIRLVRVPDSGPILVSDEGSLRLVGPGPGGLSAALADAKGAPIPGEVERAEFSGDGRWLAACSSIEGRTSLWGLAGPARWEPVGLPGDDAPAISPAFSPDGRTLLVGDASGGIRGWDLDVAGGRPVASPRPPIPPSRGKVAALSPSASGRSLLEITKADGLALVWDLEGGRGCKALPGAWVDGAFLPDESKLALIRRADEGGDVVLLDRATGGPSPIRFERPAGPDGRPSVASFGRLAVSRSGRWVAASTLESQRPMACAWRVEDGRLVHVARGHDGGLTGVDFSGDESSLLTASADGTAKLWPMDDPDIELRREAATFPNPSPDRPAITAARACPKVPGRVAAGTRGGRVFLWDGPKGGRRRADLAHLEGEVDALAFSTDGRWLAASWSLGKSIRFWSIPEGGEPRPESIRPRPHHDERVGALAAWPGGSMIVSGGDDSAVRFWGLEGRSLVGTLVARAAPGRRVDWLAYTPEGMFDGSATGEDLVKWRVGERVVTLEQSQDRHHAFQLASGFARGVKPDAPGLVDDGPRLKVEAPAAGRASGGREVELTVWSGDPDPAALRLYQDGVPVRGEGDFRPGPGPNLRATTVSLRAGENRFYAMASKPGSVDGRSDDLALRYEGEEPPGRVHVLALGVGGYPRRPLKYAHADARRISEFLHSSGAGGPDRAGRQIVLVDEEVNPARVDEAFRTLRDAVKGRPEDAVVLFLAGHTDTDVEANQFCLLLPDFPFDEAAPARDLAQGGRPGVVARGVAGGGGFKARVGGAGVMPYVVLYNRLARLDAMQRLVIIDACQAGAILDDSAVLGLRRVVERGSRAARNAYLLAARRGEPANEADALEHGLLTYTLLQGVGAPGLRRVPEGFPGPPSADLDGDGLITSAELVAYADDALPRLARMFPQLVTRAGNGPGPAPDPRAGPPELEARMKVESSGASFPLIAAPR